MRRSTLKRCAFPLALAGLPSQLCHGAGTGFDPLAFDLGPVLVRPQGQVSETYNDNVYFLKSNTKGDFISTIAPGVDLSVGEFDLNHVVLEYLMPANFYASQSRLSGVDQNLTLDGLYQGSRFSVEAVEGYISKFGLLGGSTGLLTPLRYDMYNDSVRFGYDIGGKTSLYAKASYTGEEFEHGFSLIDFADLRGTLGASYHYSPKTSVFVEGYYGHLTTHSENPVFLPSGPTARYYGLFAGLQGELATRFTWYVKGGYEVRDYGNDTSAPGAAVADVELAYDFNQRTKIDLNYLRANQTSIQYANQNSVLDSISASLTQKFGGAEKLEASVILNYYDGTYELGALNGRSSTGVGAGLDVKYHLNDWLTADCRYQFLGFKTDLPGVLNPSYDVNQFMVMLSVGYSKLPK